MKQICISCDKEYDTKAKQAIIKAVKQKCLVIKTYPQTCLCCIKKELQQEKSSYLNNLYVTASEMKKSYAKLVKIQMTYNKEKKRYDKLNQAYTALDTQQAYIEFHANKASHTIKSKEAPKRRRATSKSSVEKLLASMSPEQRANIAKHIAAM